MPSPKLNTIQVTPFKLFAQRSEYLSVGKAQKNDVLREAMDLIRKLAGGSSDSSYVALVEDLYRSCRKEFVRDNAHISMTRLIRVN